MSTAPFSHTVSVGSLTTQGKHVRIVADEEERVRIAKSLGLLEVVELTAEAELKAGAGGLVSVRGQVNAIVVQADVVTLDPVRQSVAETIDLNLEPAERASPRKERPDFPNATEEDEERDVYDSGRIDLGVLATEYLALGLNPYPRAAGVEFEPYCEDRPGESDSPFAALKRLKRDAEGG